MAVWNSIEIHQSIFDHNNYDIETPSTKFSYLRINLVSKRYP